MTAGNILMIYRVLPNTLRVLDTTLDMRVPLTFDSADCDLIASIIADEMATLIG